MKHRPCRFSLCCTAAAMATGWAGAALPDDDLLGPGCLDVTRPPYSADPTGRQDSTQAIQRAVNDARDRWLVCFFPPGTYRISDTISCEQQVSRLERPRYTDGRAQHFWDKPNRIVMLGSTRGPRPVLRLAPDAKGFDDPTQPKRAMWIWAQTRDSAPGTEEPEWGREQPNISFNHIFRGIDIDIRGHAGAIGIRHSGSQGSMLLDCTVVAEGAYAGLSNCCGQGGGTHNIEVIGGRYGIVIDRNSRFPLLNACVFRGQTEASVSYSQPSQMPSLLVGCVLEPAGQTAVNLADHGPHAGLSLVECVVRLPNGGVVCRTEEAENVFLEETFVRGARALRSGGPEVPEAADWLRIRRYSSSRPEGVNLVNGSLNREEIVAWESVAAPPADDEIRRRHWERLPSFEDEGVVSVKTFAAVGDGKADDTEAFRRAIAAADRIFVPNGTYRVAGTLELRPKTQLFGFSPTFCSIGDAGPGGGRGWQRGGESDAFAVVTSPAEDARPGLHFLSLRGRVDWRSGQGGSVLAPAVLKVSGEGGGRFYGVMARGGQFVLEGIRRPTAFYALNVERKGTNPQSVIRDCRHLRIFFFKVEAGTVNRPDAGDANTPCRIEDSEDIRVYCMYGVVRKLQEDRPMLDIADSRDILVAQLRTFSPGAFPHLVETFGEERHVVPSSSACALFLRGLGLPPREGAGQ